MEIPDRATPRLFGQSGVPRETRDYYDAIERGVLNTRPLDPRNLALLADLELEGAWRVEYFDSDGAEYIAIFAGQSAEVRA